MHEKEYQREAFTRTANKSAGSVGSGKEMRTLVSRFDTAEKLLAAAHATANNIEAAVDRLLGREPQPERCSEATCAPESIDARFGYLTDVAASLQIKLQRITSRLDAAV